MIGGVSFFKHMKGLFSDELNTDQIRKMQQIPFVTLMAANVLPEAAPPKESKEEIEPPKESKAGEGHWEQIIPTAEPRPFVPADNKKKKDDDVDLDSLGMPIKRRSNKEKFRTRIAPSSLEDN